MSTVAQARHPVDPNLRPYPNLNGRLTPHQYADPRGRGRHGRFGAADPHVIGASGVRRRGAPPLRSAPMASSMPQHAAQGMLFGDRYGDIRHSASLWSNQPTSLFGDRRARTIGDLLTVLIEIDDNASLNNATTRTRSGSDAITASNAFGLQNIVDMILPADAELSNGLKTGGTSTSKGSGQIQRDETVSLKIAATVVEVLPNGHFLISGNQEVRVNYELRDLQVAGVIRPEDISRKNTITYDKIANARISYGGRGHISDFQQPRLGQQLVELVSPF